MPPLTVVVVHWNQPQRCAATLDAFRASEVPVRFVVVDNGSDPAAIGALRGAVAGRDDVELLELPANAGFGPGANTGLRHWLDTAAGEWVALAPHDALPEPTCVGRVLAEVERRPTAGLACADVGDGLMPVVDPYFGGMSVQAPAGDGWQQAGYPHGTLLFARRACLAEIGLFDERYFAYCEEADLGERARRAGWEVGIVRGAGVRNPHLGGAADVVDYLMHRNTLLLVRDHFGRYHALVRLLIALLHLAIGTAVPSKRPWLFAPAARVRALVDYTLGRFGPPPAGLVRATITPDRG
jgi:GT2 family glycosyltransferase